MMAQASEEAQLANWLPPVVLPTLTAHRPFKKNVLSKNRQRCALSEKQLRAVALPHRYEKHILVAIWLPLGVGVGQPYVFQLVPRKVYLFAELIFSAADVRCKPWRDS